MNYPLYGLDSLPNPTTKILEGRWEKKLNEELKVYITAQIDGLKKQLKEATKETEKFAKDSSSAGEKVKKIFSGLGTAVVKVSKVMATAIASVATAVGVIGTKALSSFADYEQLVGGVETLFGDSADTIQKYASEAYKTAGISANQYMEQATSFSASLLQSLGGDTKAAAETTNMAIIDMADNANKMGTSLESIQNAYQGFAKQNYTMLDNLKLGYGGTKEEMERLIADAERISGVKYDISNLNDVYQAIHVIQGEIGITGTTALEASTTISGSIGMLKASWQNLVAGIANDNADIGQLVDNFTDSITTAVGNIVPKLLTILPNLTQGFKALIQNLLPKLPPIIQQILPTLIESAVALIQGLVDVMPDIVSALLESLPALIGGIVALVNGIIEALPSLMASICEALPTLVPQLIEGIIALVLSVCQNFGSIIQPIIDMLPDLIMNIVNTLIDNLPALINGVIQLVLGIVGATDQIIEKLVPMIPDIIIAIVEAIIENIPTILSGVLQVIEAVLGVVWTLVESIWDIICQGWDWLVDNVFSPIGNWIYENIIEPVANLFEGLWKTVSGFFVNLWDDIKNVFSVVGSWINEHVVQPVVGFFQEMGQAIKSVWDGIWNAIKKVVNGIIGGINGMIRGVCSGVNFVIKALNKIHFEIPDWVPLVGGKSFGFNIGQITAPQIPLLAQGGILTKPTLAVAGEKGPEGVFPLTGPNADNWMDNLASKLASKLTGDGNIPIVLNVDGKTFAQTAIRTINEMTRQNGSLALNLV